MVSNPQVLHGHTDRLALNPRRLVPVCMQVNVSDEDGATLLHIAVQSGHLAIVQVGETLAVAFAISPLAEFCLDACVLV